LRWIMIISISPSLLEQGDLAVASVTIHNRTRRPWFIAVFTVLLLGAGAAAFTLTTRPPVVLTSAVGRGEIVGRVVATGPVQPAQDQDLTSRVSGILEVLDVKEGDRVTRGQVIASVTKRPFEGALAEAESRLSGQESGLAQLQRRTRQAGEQAALKLQAAQERLRLATAQLADRELAAGRAVTEAEYALSKLAFQAQRLPDSAEVKHDRAHAEEQVRAAKADLQRLASADHPARLQVALAEIDLQDARQALAASAVLPGEIAAAEAAVAAARIAVVRAAEDLRNTEITAPFEGAILQVHARQGSGVGPGTRLVTMAAVDKAVAMANVDEADIDQVAVGQAVNITTPSVASLVLPGVVTRILPRATKDTSNATVIQTEVEFKNEGGRLRPGMNADVEIAVARRANVVRAPLAVLRGKGSDRFVFVYAQGSVHRRAVTIGLRDSRWAEVLSGLQEGEQIVVGPERLLKTLQDGQTVQVEANR